MDITPMIPTREKAEAISRKTVGMARIGNQILGLMCECHYGIDFDVTNVDSVLDIMEHTQFSHVSRYEMYLVRVDQITW